MAMTAAYFPGNIFTQLLSARPARFWKLINDELPDE
jgi:hypothetical protein